MTRSFVVALALAILPLACSQPVPESQPVPLTGTPADMALLEGEWAGEYRAYRSEGRSGPLMFRLTTVADTARGDALMDASGRMAGGTIHMEDPWAEAPPHQILSITFTPAAGGTVFGKLALYHDPVCGCEVQTTFMGRIDGNLIEGTYSSAHVNGGERSDGSWRVVRRFPD